jgi:hypothetical protein
MQGGHHQAEDVRIGVVQAAGKLEGVGGINDLAPTATGTSGNVTVAGGACYITGDDSVFQGMYCLINSGNELVAIAPTGGSSRKDIIVARVQDPQYVGSADPDSNAAAIVAISGTSAAYPAVPSSAVLIAYVDIPASTSLITQGMITDKRTLAQPRSTRQLVVVQPAGTYAIPTGLTPALWPGTGPGSALAIPTWCSWVTIKVDVAGILNTSGASLAAGIRATVGGTAGLIQSQDTAIASGINSERISTVVAYDGVMPSAYRGTTQNFYTTAYHPTGSAQSDAWTTIVWDITFKEKLN